MPTSKKRDRNKKKKKLPKTLRKKHAEKQNRQISNWFMGSLVTGAKISAMQCCKKALITFIVSAAGLCSNDMRTRPHIHRGVRKSNCVIDGGVYKNHNQFSLRFSLYKNYNQCSLWCWRKRVREVKEKFKNTCDLGFEVYCYFGKWPRFHFWEDPPRVVWSNCETVPVNLFPAF